MTDDSKLPLATPNPADDLLAQLREAAPQIFSEGKIDLDKFKAALGEHIDPRIERYGLNWAGKSDAFRNVQQPSVGTLLPQPDESVNWDSTENLIIEGDNLEVLKLLQKPYHGKVKMIYIDPPYNTGNEFIYPDNFREGLDDYLRYSGQVSEAGIRQSTNTETSGRFHSKWLNMMYPRLFLARNLLRDDGVIFVSIDDNEVHNLRMLMNEVFGEENFIGLFAINASPSAIDYGHIAKQHDYAVFYAKSVDEAATNQLAEESKEFKYSDGIGPFNIYPLYNGNVAFNPKTRPNLYYPFYLNPNRMIGGDFYEISLESQDGWVEVYPVVSRKEGIQRVWRWGRAKASQDLNKEIIGYKTEDGEYRVVQKTRHTGKVIRSLQMDNDVSSRRGTGDFEALFNSKLFSFPKPVELIKRFVKIGTEADSLVLDFFAGSGTTGQAVLEQNEADGGKRKFILVQLPEKTDNPKYPAITDITRERVRRVITKFNQADNGQLNLEGKAKPDRGFRAFKLSSSNFKIWDAALASTEPDQLALQLRHYTDNVDDSRTQQDILYELILKAGLPLAAKVEQIEVEGKPIFSVADGQLLICLENPITQAVLRGMMAREPLQFLCLDTAFHGNDPLKTNVVLEAQSHGITFRTV